MRSFHILALTCMTTVATAAYAEPIIPLPGYPVWGVKPFMKRLPAGSKYNYVIHQKTLQPYDFTATINKHPANTHYAFVTIDIVTNYSATCPDGKPAVIGQEPKHIKSSTPGSLSDTVTVFVEKLGFLGKCSGAPTSGSVTLIATAKDAGGGTKTSSITVDLEP